MSRASRIVLWLLAAVSLAPAAAFAAALRIGLAGAPASLDPQFRDARVDNIVARHLFDSLLRVDPHQRLLPGLAIGLRRLDATTWRSNYVRAWSFPTPRRSPPMTWCSALSARATVPKRVDTAGDLPVTWPAPISWRPTAAPY